MSEEKPKTETPKKLSDEEIQKIVNMDYAESRNYYIDSDEREKITNTIKAIELDLASVKGLKRFIETGVLVNSELIVFIMPDEYRLGVKLRAFESGPHGAASVVVDMTADDVKRLSRMCIEALKCASKARDLKKLKDIYKEKIPTRRW